MEEERSCCCQCNCKLQLISIIVSSLVAMFQIFVIYLERYEDEMKEATRWFPVFTMLANGALACMISISVALRRKEGNENSTNNEASNSDVENLIVLKRKSMTRNELTQITSLDSSKEND